MPLQIGPYQIFDEIGRGSSGAVYKAINILSKRELCVKVFEKKNLETPQDSEFFKREIKILSSLSHPNIVEYVELLENEDKFFLFQEYCPGMRLTTYIEKNRIITDKTMEIIFRQIFSALSYIHKAGVGHRDIKPDNVIINTTKESSSPRKYYTNNITVKIIDFGLSTDDNTKLRTTFCGSLAYAAPECIRREPYIAWRSDIWSTGVMLYQCCTKKLPWNTSNIALTMRQIVCGQFIIPTSVSPLIRKVIIQCMKQDPAERPSADDLLQMTMYVPKERNNSLPVSSNTPIKQTRRVPSPQRTPPMSPRTPISKPSPRVGILKRTHSIPLIKVIPPKVTASPRGKIALQRMKRKSLSYETIKLEDEYNL